MARRTAAISDVTPVEAERLRLTEVVRKFNDRHARTLGWAGILYVHARGSTKIDHGVLVPRSYVDEMHRLVEQRREREP